MSTPRPVDIGSLNRRLKALEATIGHLDASRRLSFTGTVRNAVRRGGRLPTDWGTAVTLTLPVPDWCWRVHVLALASTKAYADLYDLGSSMRSRTVIEGRTGDESIGVTGGVASEAYHVSLAAWSSDVEDPPPTVEVRVETMTEYDEHPWPADSRNASELNALVLYLR